MFHVCVRLKQILISYKWNKLYIFIYIFMSIQCICLYMAASVYFSILILEKEPVFPFFMISAKQGNYWYHFYNVFGMKRSLTGDWTRDLPYSKCWNTSSEMMTFINRKLSLHFCFFIHLNWEHSLNSELVHAVFLYLINVHVSR